jgi:hypothetical protein
MQDRNYYARRDERGADDRRDYRDAARVPAPQQPYPTSYTYSGGHDGGPHHGYGYDASRYVRDV